VTFGIFMKTILKSNLYAALCEAIDSRTEYEKKVLKFDKPSAMVEGWEEIVRALKLGEEVQIK